MCHLRILMCLHKSQCLIHVCKRKPKRVCKILFYKLFVFMVSYKTKPGKSEDLINGKITPLGELLIKKILVSEVLGWMAHSPSNTKALAFPKFPQTRKCSGRINSYNFIDQFPSAGEKVHLVLHSFDNIIERQQRARKHARNYRRSKRANQVGSQPPAGHSEKPDHVTLWLSSKEHGIIRCYFSNFP